MDLNVYSIEYPDQLAPETFRSLLTRLPAAIQQKIQRYRRWEDAYGSMFGKLLLRLAIRKAGLSPDLTALQFNDFGKPYLEDGPEFNLSHSGNRVVCVLSRQGRVGIDLEKPDELVIDDFRSQFTAAEWIKIIGSAKPLLTFYHFWTAKESLIKADGQGLQIPLDKLDICDSGYTTGIRLNETRWFLRELSTFPGYCCHVACEAPPGHLDIEEVMLETFDF